MGFWGRTSSPLAGQGAGLAYFCFRAPTTLLGRYFRCWPPKAEVAASSPSHAPGRADNIDLPGKERWDLFTKPVFQRFLAWVQMQQVVPRVETWPMPTANAPPQLGG